MKCQVCGEKAHYGLEYKKPTHCKNDKSDEMCNVTSKRCKEIGCKKIPAFGLEWKKPIYCADHKLDEMSNVKTKQCLETGCTKTPNFGPKGHKAIYCGDHKFDNMVDVTHTHCLHTKCEKRPTFGIKEGKAKYCVDHKFDEMVDVTNKQCLISGCKKISTFGLIWSNATHCVDHKSNAMFNVKNKRCITCDTTIINPNYKPNCARCHFYLHPDDPRIRNYKVKEHAFMHPLKEIYPDIILDKIISGGCSKRRPDGFIDCLTHSIIIEIDEDQHIGYESLCDNRRTMELFQDLGERPIIFIRLNPDGYKLDSKTIKGCFNRTKSNELKLIKKEFSIRFNALLEAVEAAKQIPGKEIHPIKLFYSE